MRSTEQNGQHKGTAKKGAHDLKRLVLHIGTHKTGTSSFQESLKKNAKTLISCGIRPVRGPVFQDGKRVPGKNRVNHTHLTHLLLRPEIRSGARVRRTVPVLSPEQRLRQLDRLAERLSGLDEETLLISAEGLCFLREASEQALLRRFVERVGREVQTLVVFRKEGDWRASWENQLMKQSNEIYQIAKTEAEDVSLLGDWYFDKTAIKEFWAPFNLHQIEFEAHTNIVKPLYDAIGQSDGGLQTEVFKNRRRTIATLE